MGKTIEKIIQSKYPPNSTNVLWDDGENLKIVRNGNFENVVSTMENTGNLNVEVTVDNTTGTPSVNTTVEGSTIKLAFSGLKGETGPQGNSGYQGAEGELEVVNNLIDGGESAALSAEQGKVLKEELTELSAVIGNNEATYKSEIFSNQGLIDTSGKIYPSESAYAYSDFIAVEKGQDIDISISQGPAIVAAIVVYDKEDNFIRSMAGEAYTRPTLHITIQEGESKVRFCSSTSGFSYFSATFSASGLAKEVSDLSGKLNAPSGILAEAFNYPTILGSARFGKAESIQVLTYNSFIDGQEGLVGKNIVGIKIAVAKAGDIVVTLCENFRQSSPQFKSVQTFNVVKGINHLLFDTPIVLKKGEALGLSPTSSANIYYGGYDSNFNKGYWWYNETNGIWNLSGADLLVSILGDEVMVSDELNDVSKIKSATLSSVVYPTTPPLLYHHLFIDKIYLSSQPTIPSQSIFDVAVAAALGFKMIEFNVTITSDGVPVTGHVVGGKLETLIDLSGNAVAVDVSSITFEQLRNNYRYKSVFPQFCTPISSLEECLRECQRYGITPLVQCINQSVVDLTEKVVAKRYVAYSANRTMTDATIYAFSNNATIEQLLASCDSVGYPYILGVGADILDNLSDDEIKDLVERVHAKGCWINWAGSYHTAPSNLRMKRLGLDSCASGWEVPEFMEYDVRKMGDAVKGWESFTGTFTKASDSASLSNGQTISADIPQLGIIAKSQLAIHFKGKLTINFGKVNASFESDGNSIMVMTSVVENADSDIVITSEGTSKIYSVDYKTASVL